MISVCVATYNGEKYIKEQIESMICQLSPEDEIVVSDDGSTDGTIAIIQSFKDDRIKIVQGPCKSKPALNFENALIHAKGDYIFLADQDDVWEQNKVEVMMNELKTNDLVLSDCSIVDKDLNTICPSYFSMLTPKTGVINNIIKNHYLGCCLAFRRNVLQVAIPFPKNVIMHDIWIGLCADIYYRTAIISQPLMKYRRHGNNESSASGKSNLPIWFRIEYRVRTLFQLILRCLKQNRLQL